MKFGLAASHDKHHSDPSWRHTWENFKEILTDFPEYLPNTYLHTICMPRKAPRIGSQLHACQHGHGWP